MSAPPTRSLLQVVTSTNRRGAEVFAVSLGEALERRGWAVRTIALAPGDIGERLDLPTLGARPLAPNTVRALRAEVRDVAVVTAHGSRTLPACALATLGTDIPFVYRNIGDPRFWASTHLRRLRAGWAMRRARRVVALSPTATDALAEHYHVARERITAIPRAVDIELHRPASPGGRAEARRALGLPADRPVVAFLGSLSEEKDPQLALAAVACLDDAHLLVAGDGTLRGELERSAAAIPGRVHFLGAVADPGPCYDAADVVVVTSHSEGLPGVLIEAGLRALPTVTTDVGFVRDVVADGETGFVVTSRDPSELARALQVAIDDHDRLGGAARRRCRERFDLEAAATQWDELLTSLTVD